VITTTINISAGLLSRQKLLLQRQCEIMVKTAEKPAKTPEFVLHFTFQLIIQPATE